VLLPPQASSKCETKEEEEEDKKDKKKSERNVKTKKESVSAIIEKNRKIKGYLNPYQLDLVAPGNKHA
jgi:F0F1-type ATP synthase assembly protein I